MDDFDQLTLQHFKLMQGGKLPYSVRWPMAQTHEERFAIVEELLDECYVRLSDGRQHNQTHSEDALTQNVVDMMSAAGVRAERDIQIGGHADIVVRSQDNFLFLGEAKIHRGYKWLFDGFKQLSTRYGLAQLGRDRGEIVIYCRKRDAGLVLRAWQRMLLRERPEVTVVSEDIENGGLNFKTSHVCKASGCNFHIRHKIVPLYFAPQK